ncbi:MAG: arylamine N-acetyltransferase [Verrucomicrobiales bacterium]|nr:arylamine N-acetyltransferase [Verrucomicrobiales bacterium]
MNLNPLPGDLRERVLESLGLQGPPQADWAGLHRLYDAWCRNIPFDNLRKLLHLRGGLEGPLPGATPEDFLQSWIQYGTGGTCWSNAAALHSLLTTLGFDARLGLGTMLVVPDLPPNHGTVLVTLDSQRFLVDGSMLHGEPLLLEDASVTGVGHPAWGVRCDRRDGRWHVWWRPLHKVDGFECRLEHFDATPEDYRQRYEQTRGWSPFNYEVSARRNRGDSVSGVAFGHAVTLNPDGSVHREPVDLAERNRILIEEVGIREELVAQLPADIPTPPPPGSKTAQASSATP